MNRAMYNNKYVAMCCTYIYIYIIYIYIYIYIYPVHKNLDGMFTKTPTRAQEFDVLK